MGTTLPKPKSLRSPCWRLQICLSTDVDIESYGCPYITKLYSYLYGEDSDASSLKDVEEAYLLYYLPQSRAILSSLILANADTTAISSYTGSSEDVVIAFSKLFFDVSVFPNKLVIKDYVDSLPEATSIDKNYKALMRVAISLGSRYIAWKMSLPIEDELDINKVHTAMLEDSYWRAREHKPFNIDDSKAKESKSWVPQVLRAIDSIASSKSGGELSVETLRLKLIKTDSTVQRASIASDLKG